jgi:hypothetical protein
MRRIYLPFTFALLLALALSGCTSPNQANIQLRKDKQALEEQLATLKSEHAADRARIETLEKEKGTLSTLPQQRLDNLYTVHSMKLGRLSGGIDLNTRADGDEALKLYLTLLDQEEEPIKATGKVVVEALDLARTGDNRVGRWEFDAKKMKETWRSLGILHAYVLVCPFQSPPEHSSITVNLTYTDELTGRRFSDVTRVEIKVKPAAGKPVAGQ